MLGIYDRGLMGEPPYPGATAQAVLAKILTDEAPVASKIRRTIPPHLDAAIRKALEKLPADRFRGAQHFAEALTNPAFRHAGPVEALTPAGPWKRLALATGAACLISAGVADSALLSDPGAPPPPVFRGTIPVGADADVYLGGEQDARWADPAPPRWRSRPRA